MSQDRAKAEFFQAQAFGVAGASVQRNKFGNKVLRCYQENGLRVIPVHPQERQIEGLDCVASVADLPDDVASLSIVTPPPVTEQVVVQAVARGIRNLWMQPGTDSPAAVAYCRQHEVNLIHGGPCLLVELGFADH